MGGPRGAGTVSRLFTKEHDDAIRTGVMTHGVGKWLKIQQGAECLADFTQQEVAERWRKVLDASVRMACQVSANTGSTSQRIDTSASPILFESSRASEMAGAWCSRRLSCTGVHLCAEAGVLQGWVACSAPGHHIPRVPEKEQRVPPDRAHAPTSARAAAMPPLFSGWEQRTRSTTEAADEVQKS